MPLKSKSNKRKRNPSKNNELSEFIRIQIYALIIYLIMFFLFSTICLLIDLSKNNTYYMSLIMLTISSFAVGFLSGVKIRQNGLVTGVLYALPINLLFLIISFIFNGFKGDFSALITAAVMIVASAVGGIISVNMKVRK